MTKLKAFSYHLAFSILIFLIPAYLILFHWYPMPLFMSDGGRQAFFGVAAAGFVFGPFLTLILYKKGKKGMTFDLVLIALLQTAAFVWSGWAAEKYRPIALVYAEEALNPISAEEFRAMESDYELVDTLGPQIIFIEGSYDLETMQQVRLESLRRGKATYLRGDLYKSVDENEKAAITRFAIDMTEYVKENPEVKDAYLDTKTKFNQAPSRVYVAMYSWFGRNIVLLDLEEMQILASIKSNPTDYIIQRGSTWFRENSN